jgi:hypothetical protein
MSKTLPRVAAAVVAGLILVAGFSYAATRTTSYQSSASLLLAPKAGTSPDVLSSLLDSFQRSGTAGTYVELISSKDTLTRAGVPAGVTVSVRSVPDARTINVEADGPENVVQPALRGVIKATQAREGELGDVWRAQVLGSPSAPAVSGISKTQLFAATILLAILGALFVIVVLRRYRFVPTEGGAGPAELGIGAAPGPGSGGLGGLPAGGVQSRSEIEQPAEVLVHFDLESFRFVRASATTVLCQVTGYWRSDHPRELAEPTLLLHDGTRMHPIAPLAAPASGPPAAGPETPLWRGSYAAPIEIFERHERIALRAGPGAVIGLPEPVEQGLIAGGGSNHVSTNGHGEDAHEELATEDAAGDADEAARTPDPS